MCSTCPERCTVGEGMVMVHFTEELYMEEPGYMAWNTANAVAEVDLFDQLVDRTSQAFDMDPEAISVNGTYWYEYGEDGIHLRVFDSESLSDIMSLASATGAEQVISLHLGIHDIPSGSGKCLAFPYLSDTDMVEQMPSDIKAAILDYITPGEFRATNFDNNNEGRINDGGEDAYDNGHWFTTSECGGNYNDPIRPWVTGMVPTDTTCLGPEGQYQISQFEGIMIFYAYNGATSAIDVRITGNKGNGLTNSPQPEVIVGRRATAVVQCYPENNQASSYVYIGILRNTAIEAGAETITGWYQNCRNEKNPHGGTGDCTNMFWDNIPAEESVMHIYWMEQEANRCVRDSYEELVYTIFDIIGC